MYTGNNVVIRYISNNYVFDFAHGAPSPGRNIHMRLYDIIVVFIYNLIYGFAEFFD